jgi:PadR family transcriptional regulator PadR
MPRDAIPPGTLHLLILRTLARGVEMHGFEIAEAIERLSGDVLTVEEGSLYPALQRMLVKGWLTAEWGSTADNRRARYYQLTRRGRKQLDTETAQFQRVTGAIARVTRLDNVDDAAHADHPSAACPDSPRSARARARRRDAPASRAAAPPRG